jgi:hypothetical protein
MKQMKTGRSINNPVLDIPDTMTDANEKYKTDETGSNIKNCHCYYLMSADRREQVNIRQMTSRLHSHIFRCLTSTPLSLL